jgi:hypothetical protein
MADLSKNEKVTVIRVPGGNIEVPVTGPMTIADLFKAGKITSADKATVTIDGKKVDLKTVVQPGATVMLTDNVKGA